ncbi:MAG: hypothetical protein WDN69_03880 [Aliidongia sp.]
MSSTICTRSLAKREMFTETGATGSIDVERFGLQHGAGYRLLQMPRLLGGRQPRRDPRGGTDIVLHAEMAQRSGDGLRLGIDRSEARKSGMPGNTWSKS